MKFAKLHRLRKCVAYRVGLAGIAVGASLLYILVAFPIVSRPIGQHIEYVSPHFFALTSMVLYLMSTALSPLLSSHRAVQVFGVLALLSFAAAYGFYATWFISVWCFFAALLSAVVYLHFVLRRVQRSGPETGVSAVTANTERTGAWPTGATSQA